MNELFSKLNRLRVNAGKTELKSWKASLAKLNEAIASLEAAGYTDVLPGANVEAQPIATEPEVARNHPPLEESGFMKATVNQDPPKQTKPKEKPRAGLARGLDNEPFARHCRQSVKAQRDAEKAKKKKPEKTSNIVGKVDPKKDPAKAKRQEEHVKAKQKARAEKPPKVKNDNEITVADLARELSIDPKVARAKLRRHEARIASLHTPGQDRWSFPLSAATELRTILTGVKS